MSGNSTESSELRTPAEWAIQDGIKILSHDGWRGGPLGPKDATEPLAREEYELRLQRSTVSLSPAALSALRESIS